MRGTGQDPQVAVQVQHGSGSPGQLTVKRWFLDPPPRDSLPQRSPQICALQAPSWATLHSDVTCWCAGHSAPTAFVVTAASVLVRKAQFLEVKEGSQLMVSGRQCPAPGPPVPSLYDAGAGLGRDGLCSLSSPGGRVDMMPRDCTCCGDPLCCLHRSTNYLRVSLSASDY